MPELSNSEIFRVVNQYIGVSGGYLGDFTYRSHSDFYIEYCDLDGIDPSEIAGTTRERFIEILKREAPHVQARILRGILRKYPSNSSSNRTEERAAEIESMIRQLESGCGVPSSMPSFTSQAVTRAINDAETLLRESGASSGVDRMHTAFHGFLLGLCARNEIPHSTDASITELYKQLRQYHPGLQDLGEHSGGINRILKAFAAAVDSLNTLRNQASIAHPNEAILDREEAYLYVNAIRTLMAYIDAKTS